MRVLSDPRRRAWDRLDMFCIVVGVFGLAFVGCYVVAVQLVEWFT